MANKNGRKKKKGKKGNGGNTASKSRYVLASKMVLILILGSILLVLGAYFFQPATANSAEPSTSALFLE